MIKVKSGIIFERFSLLFNIFLSRCNNWRLTDQYSLLTSKNCTFTKNAIKLTLEGVSISNVNSERLFLITLKQYIRPLKTFQSKMNPLVDKFGQAIKWKKNQQAKFISLILSP